MAFGGLLPTRVVESNGPIVNVSTQGQLTTALGSAANGSIINLTASINGGGAQYTISRNAAVGGSITITSNVGVQVTNYSQWYITGSYLRFLDIDISGCSLANFKFTDTANHCEVDHCHIHNGGGMGVLVTSAASDIQIWNNQINNNGTDPTLDHGIYFAHSNNTGVIANNVIYDNAAYNIQIYPDSPRVISTCNTLDGGATRGGMVVGSETGLTDNVMIIGTIGTNAAYYCIHGYDPAGGDTNNNAYDCLGFGNAAGDFAAGGGFTYTNCTHANPLYVNQAGHDYHLQAGSPAIGKIQAARFGYVPPLDRDGVARVTADAGAYAFTGSTPPVNTSVPVISGFTVVGSTLTCSTGSWSPSPSSYAYQWLRETGVGTGIYAAIGGQISNSYVVVSGDIGLRLECEVTAT